MERPIPRPASPERGWIDFLERAHTKRLSLEDFTRVVPIVAWNHRLGPLHITDLLLGTGQARSKYRLDSRSYGYVEVLLTKLRIIDGISVLRVLYRYSTAHNHKPPRTLSPDETRQVEKAKRLPHHRSTKVERWENSYIQEEFFFKILARTLPTHIAAAGKAGQIVLLLGDWIQLLTDVGTADLSHVNNPQSYIFGARFALMELAVAAFENQRMQLVLSHPAQKGTVRSHGPKRSVVRC